MGSPAKACMAASLSAVEGGKAGRGAHQLQKGPWGAQTPMAATIINT